MRFAIGFALWQRRVLDAALHRGLATVHVPVVESDQHLIVVAIRNDFIGRAAVIPRDVVSLLHGNRLVHVSRLRRRRLPPLIVARIIVNIIAHFRLSGCLCFFVKVAGLVDHFGGEQIDLLAA